MTILDEILAHKRSEVAAAKSRISPAERSRQRAPACTARRPAPSDIGASRGSPPAGPVTVS